MNVERSGNIHLPPGGRKIKSLPGATTTSDWAGLADLLPPDERLGLPARPEVARGHYLHLTDVEMVTSQGDTDTNLIH